MKKGQLQIQETIIVVFICVVIILIGLGIFYKYTMQTIQNEQTEHMQSTFDNQIITIPTNSLFSCEQLTQQKNCIDATKLLAITQLDKRRLQRLFPDTKISVKQIYPKTNDKECTVQNPKDCNIYTVLDNKPKTVTSTRIQETAISLYNPLTNSYSIARMELEGYNR